jgi:hypothetical protein
MMRFAVSALAGVVLALAPGCGGGSNSPKGRTGPNTQGVLLTVLSYGRAASAKEVCPLLSADFAKRAGGGDPNKCATRGQATLCPCQSQSLATSSISVQGDTATAIVMRMNGTRLKLALVRVGGDWKIDSVHPG